MLRILISSSRWIVTGVVALATLAPLGVAHARKITPLYTFKGGSDGRYPRTDLVQDGEGNFYGTTEAGGTHNAGTVFKLAPDGTETVLYAFTGGSDGSTPYAGVVADKAGNLYGTTISGGTNGGVVFKVAPDGTETVLHAFAGGKDGLIPYSRLLLYGGNLYGTTFWGGSRRTCTDPQGCGTVFKIGKDGTETRLYAFTGGNDGGHPSGGLISDKDGNLYGTTSAGGSGDCYTGCGTVFKLVPDGSETVLHSFANGSDGRLPLENLIVDHAGNLYGTTTYGGTYSAGTVFRLAPDGTETVLHSFANGSDGAYPLSALVLDDAGNLYGTTSQGGDFGTGYGIIFKITPAGTERVLHTFCYNCRAGSRPAAGLVADSVGNLYGSTTEGGASCSCGTVFKLENGIAAERTH
jgi:uncharacterized repeat protein (TIGR03803 family)